MVNQNDPGDLLTFCKVMVAHTYNEIYKLDFYEETGIHTVYNLDNNTYNTVLVTDEVIFLHQAILGTPSYEAFHKHHSFVQLMAEDERGRISKVEVDASQMNFFSIEDTTSEELDALLESVSGSKI